MDQLSYPEESRDAQQHKEAHEEMNLCSSSWCAEVLWEHQENAREQADCDDDKQKGIDLVFVSMSVHDQSPLSSLTTVSGLMNSFSSFSISLSVFP